MPNRRKEALEYHAQGRPGKIEVVPTKSVATQRDLTLAYSPGVAEPCREIHARLPTGRLPATRPAGNLVAVVSNGTAVLGLGDIGPLAAKPVMEGKGVLFKKFRRDRRLRHRDRFAPTDPHDVIRFCEMLEPTVGGINLEDIHAPDCFVIERDVEGVAWTFRSSTTISTAPPSSAAAALVNAARTSSASPWPT